MQFFLGKQSSEKNLFEALIKQGKLLSQSIVESLFYDYIELFLFYFKCTTRSGCSTQWVVHTVVSTAAHVNLGEK